MIILACCRPNYALIVTVVIKVHLFACPSHNRDLDPFMEVKGKRIQLISESIAQFKINSSY